ncbi:MAG: late competence development ComFB family protein [Nitrospinota bacterium]|nr:late competence development ComFB family protein [Nitrospinota bacterium]
MSKGEEIIRHHEFRERSINENENRVIAKIRELWKTLPGLCICGQCLDNIFCLALNYLPPRYENAVIHHIGKPTSLSDEEIDSSVRMAMEKVHRHPKVAAHKVVN